MKEVQKATWIEPAISWPAYSLKNLPVHTGIVPSYAEILENLLNDMGSDPSLIVAVPWVGIGGADLASINYAQALKEIYGRTGKRIMILSTGIPEKTKRELIPSGIKFVQIDSRFQQLSEELKSRLIAQAFTITKPEVVIAVNCFDLLNSLRSFGKQISENTRIYSTFFSFDRIGNNYPTQPITDGSRDFLDYVTGIFTDNKKIAELLSDILGRDEGYFQVHYQPAFGNNQKLEQELIGQQPSKGSAIRLLWPHRLDKEKKPEVLIEIMKSARQKGVNLEIDVYGEAVLNSHSKDLLKSFKTYGITYQGPYQGGLVALPVEEYDALLLTSESEGMPIVVLQAMSLGLPVIATNVGGLSEVIQEGQTGFLVNGPEDITGFINAIIELQEVEFRNLVAQQAKTKVLEQHSWKSFVDSVSRIVQ